MPSPQSVLTDQVKLYTRSRDLSWSVDHLPPNTRIYLFINGLPFSQYAAPRGGALGDSIFSNEFGHAEGQLTIPRNAEEKFLVGEIRLTFADNPTDIATSTFTVESTFYSLADAEQYNTDQGGTKTTRQPIPFRRVPNSTLRETDSYTNNITYTSNRLDLVAQTFTVDATIYPQGLFVSSVDLFFITTDPAMPISVELRNTVNGIPAGDSYLSGSHVLKYPSEIAIAVQTSTGITTLQTQNSQLLTALNAFSGSLVYRGVLLETYLQQYAPIASGATQETLSITNIYDNAQPSINGIFVTLLPGYANYVIERRNPIETYNLTLDPLPAGVSTLPNSSRTYTDPRTGTKYSSGVTVGVNFMVRNGVLYKFPEPPDNTVVFNVSGGLTPTSVELEYTQFADELVAGTNVGFESTAASTPLDAAGRFPATNFQFDHPIYLAPGTYAICIRTNSSQYNIATSRIDLPLLSDSGPRVPESLNGALFRAGNAGGRTPDLNEDLCYVLYKCKFDTGIRSLFLDSKAPDTQFRYDAFMLRSTTLEFPGVSFINKKVSHRSFEGQAGIFDNTTVNNIVRMDYRSLIASEGDSALEMIFQTNTADLSPVIDKEKLLGVMLRNNVVPFEQDTSDSELTPESGVSQARYVSKIISLLPGFESNGMEVRVDVNRKIGTDIEVFVKVLAPNDTEPPAKRPWKRMRLVSNDGTKQFVGFSENEFVTEYYQLLDPELQYEDIVNVGENNVPAKFIEFNRYMVKVVFYSQNPVFVPKIKNLFASAAIDVPSNIITTIGSGAGSVSTLKLNLADLQDVSNDAPSGGDLLTYNSSTGLWEAKAAPTGSSYTLDDLSDVEAPNPSVGHVLTWSGNNWQAAVPTLGASSGTTTGGGPNGEISPPPGFVVDTTAGQSGARTLEGSGWAVGFALLQNLNYIIDFRYVTEMSLATGDFGSYAGYLHCQFGHAPAGVGTIAPADVNTTATWPIGKNYYNNPFLFAQNINIGQYTISRGNFAAGNDRGFLAPVLHQADYFDLASRTQIRRAVHKGRIQISAQNNINGFPTARLLKYSRNPSVQTFQSPALAGLNADPEGGGFPYFTITDNHFVGEPTFLNFKGQFPYFRMFWQGYGGNDISRYFSVSDAYFQVYVAASPYTV